MKIRKISFYYIFPIVFIFNYLKLIIKSNYYTWKNYKKIDSSILILVEKAQFYFKSERNTEICIKKIAHDKSIHSLLRGHFLKILENIELGITFDKSIENTCAYLRKVQKIENHNHYRGFLMLLQLIRLNKKSGNDIDSTLESLKLNLKNKINLERKVKTLTANMKLQGRVIGISPFVIGILIYIFDTDRITIFFKNTYGIGILIIMILSNIIGFLIIHKICKIPNL